MRTIHQKYTNVGECGEYPVPRRTDLDGVLERHGHDNPVLATNGGMTGTSGALATSSAVILKLSG
jgi:hypothetical protein